MATYPYTSGQGALVSMFAQLRKGFPPKVDAGYMQRFGIAPANESYIIGILRFLGIIDDEGNKVDASAGYFFGGDPDFEAGVSEAAKTAYAHLFSEMGDDAFQADRNVLTNWFRNADKTSQVVGQRQAATFLTLAALAGHGTPPAAARNAPAKKTSAASSSTSTAPAKKVPAKKVPAAKQGNSVNLGNSNEQNSQNVGLTVRIEVNLPAGGDAETYDSIFASIKKHLMP